MNYRTATWRVGILLFALAVPIAGTAEGQGDPPTPVPAFLPNRNYSSVFPFEHVDPTSGSLSLTFTDLVLPGDGGRDLQFTRTFQTSNPGAGWQMGIAGVPLAVRDTWGQAGDVARPVFETSNGWIGALIPLDENGGTRRVMLTDSFWTYDRQTRTLSLPDGSVASFNTDGALSQVQDVFGHVVLTLTRTGAETQITQFLSNGQSRVVVLTGLPWTYPAAAGTRTLTYNGRTWQYPVGTQPGDGHWITEVLPPAGPAWHFDNGQLVGQPFTVTTPGGGQITYTFEIVEEQWWVHTRTITDPRTGVSATWTFTYDRTGDLAPGQPLMSRQTTITAPDGSQETLTVARVEGSGDGCTRYLNRCILLTSRTHSLGGVTLESETRTYQAVPMRRTPTPSGMGLPELATRTITRDGRSYTTTFAYHNQDFGDYHQPWQVTEQGDAGTRTTTRTFVRSDLDSGSPYLGARVATEQLAMDGHAYDSATVTDMATGFRTSVTQGGVTTTFTPDAWGNVASTTDARGKVTAFTYDWGTLKETQTPLYTLTREINPDGTVHSETQAGRTTTFDYDALTRLTQTQPPQDATAGAPALPIAIDYDNTSAASTQTTRGASTLTTTLDGFGRPLSTENAVGVRTETTYDAMGRPVFETLPFLASDGPTGGTTRTYDGLGRVSRETHADTTYREYTYGAGTMAVRDENGHVTTYTRVAFGNPDDSRLVGVHDAAGHDWAYTYNALGSLTRVSGPDNVTRTWNYDAQNRLTSETHPESGTVTYTQYDAAGNLTQKQDANGTVFTYTYDDNRRLTRLNAGGRITTVAYEPGSDNRVLTRVDGVETRLAYDPAGRLKWRDDALEGKEFRTYFEYDGNDQLTTLTYPSHRKVQYAYDAEGRITRVSNPVTQTVYASTFSYHPTGAMTGYTAGNNTVTTLTYDPQRAWVTTIASGPLHLGYSAYDGVGNVTQIADPRAGYTQSFTYDALDRLSTASGIWGGLTYTYDAHGNRQSANSLAYTYYSNNRFRLQEVPGGGGSLSYDPNGNLTSGPQFTYTYAPGNVLVTSHAAGTTTHFSYDADDWRVKKDADGQATVYSVRGPNGQLLEQWQATTPNHTVRDYIYAGSRLLADATTTPVAE